MACFLGSFYSFTVGYFDSLICLAISFACSVLRTALFMEGAIEEVYVALNKRFTAENVLADDKLRKGIHGWGRKGRVSIAHVEREHAKNNHAFACSGFGANRLHPKIETGILKSCLRLRMPDHVERGGVDFPTSGHVYIYISISISICLCFLSVRLFLCLNAL